MNRLKAYVRRTILQSAREYAYPKSRRTAESTRAAFMDAMRGTDTGWWADLIYTAGMLEMARKYSRDIITALNEYQDATGETYTFRAPGERDRTASDIALGVAANRLMKKPYTLADYHGDDIGRAQGASDTLLGLRFAVEWYAGELARDYCPDL